MKYKDYYKILGVANDADATEIKRAYRRQARKFHPDVSKEANAEAQFKEVGEAYEVLRNPEKRAAYDQLGADWKAGQEFRPPPGWNTGFEFSENRPGEGSADFSDFFESLFGRGHATGRRSRGQDHFAQILIDLEDSYSGAERAITLQMPERDATGRVLSPKRTLNVRIPRGVAAGQQIRLRGQGQPDRGGKAGDLYLEVQFRPQSLYQIEGRDVYLELPVAPWEAALGAKVKAPTPGGAVDLQVPAGSGTGRKLRLKGRGIPGQPPGDFYVVLKVVLPSADTEDAKALYRDMARKMAFNPRAALGV